MELMNPTPTVGEASLSVKLGSIVLRDDLVLYSLPVHAVHRCKLLSLQALRLRSYVMVINP
jgi:hypothetical protein